MSETPLPVDIVALIVNWNTRELLAQCLTALQVRTGLLLVSAVVVDNASDDGSAEMVRTMFPHVHLLAMAENMGFVGGNNRAFAASDAARYVLLLNPDAILSSGALETMAAWMDAHLDAGACGPLLLNTDRTIQLSWSRFPTLRREFWGGHDRRFAGQTREPDLSLSAIRALPEPIRVDWVSGACLMVRRDIVMREFDGMLLDPAFHMYSEETDLCLRLAKAGYHTYFVPQAEAVHHYGQSSKQAQARTLGLLFQSKYLFFRKHYGSGQELLLRLMVAVTGCLKWVAFVLLRSPDQRDRQWAVLQSLRKQGQE